MAKSFIVYRCLKGMVSDYEKKSMDLHDGSDGNFVAAGVYEGW